MTSSSTPTAKDYLHLFVAQFSLAALLLDTLPPRKQVQRDMALAISTSDEIRQRLDSATDTEQRGMIIASRESLKAIKTTIQAGAFPIQASKARKEWIETVRQLLIKTEVFRDV